MEMGQLLVFQDMEMGQLLVYQSKNRQQAISARKRALCQLTVCFEFQSRSCADLTDKSADIKKQCFQKLSFNNWVNNLSVLLT